jgi:hypothetical protein
VRASPPKQENNNTNYKVLTYAPWSKGTANLNARADLRAGARVRHARRRPALCAHWTTPAARRAPGKNMLEKELAQRQPYKKGAQCAHFHCSPKIHVQTKARLSSIYIYFNVLPSAD